MIKVIHRCMTNSELSFKNWDNHIALFHLKEFKDAKEIYLNGKPLKWYHILKKGDLIEVIDKPQGIIEAFFSFVFWSLVVAVQTHPIIAGIVGAVLAFGAATAISAGLSGSAKAASATTQNKEYSSTTQPELRGASNDISDDIIPVVFGTTQQTPSYGQTPYRLVQDGSSTNKYRQYFIPNYNNVVYSDFKLGETSVDDYSIDYLNIEQARGSSTFIGFENCKAISVDEELSYNADEAINQSSTHSYNYTVTATSLQVDYEIEFQNVDINNFAQKSFQVVATIQRYVDGVLVTFTLTNTFNVNASDLVASGDNYVYTGSSSWSNGSSTLLDYMESVKIAPTTQTRGNTTETDNELDVILVEETVTAGTYTETVTLNASINYYLGSMSEVLNTSPPNCTEIDVILGFSQGLYSMNSSTGERYDRSTVVEIMYKTENGQWTPISSANALYIRDVNGVKQALSTSTTTVSGSKVTVHSPSDMNVADQLFFRPIGFELPEGQYTVRVRSADYAQKTNYDIGYPKCAEIQFRCTNDDVIDESILSDVNQIAFEATAYKGLSGTLKKFNYIAQAVIPVWNGTDWSTTSTTSNPAAIVRYLLTDSSVNPRAESVNHIDNETLVEYYEWCEESGYKADGIVSEACKIGEIINQILQNSQCAMIPLYNGKHTFVIDKPNKIPVGLFNMHNSWNFKWTPNVGRQTEAIRASFVENDDWAEDELTLYWYNNSVHDEPESGKTDLDYEMVKKEYKYVCDRTSVEQIVAYELETIQTKRNLFEFDVNLEAMNMMLLDRVYISNTANMQNESTGLIKSVITDNGNLTGFELYADVDIPENAKIVIRSLDYDNEKAVINVYEVINSGTDYNVYIDPVAYDGIVRGAGDITGIQDTWHYDGDLFTLGQDTIYDCTVTDIKYNDDGTATITARDY